MRIDLSKFNNSSYSRGATPFKEFSWWIVRSLIFAPWFPIPSKVKVFSLRAFGAKVGTGVVIRSRVNITMPWRVELGDNVWIGEEVGILSLDTVKVGSNVCLSQRAYLCTGSHDFEKQTFDLITGPIEIENSCWVGALSFLGPGVTMRQGSRCLAGAVVVKDVAKGRTVAGVPAKEIGL